MPPKLALFFGFLFIIVIFKIDSKQKVEVSYGLWAPLLWYAICVSRPVGVWLSILGIPVGSTSSDPTSGSPIDRAIYSIFIFVGIYIISKRKVIWSTIGKSNVWLFSFAIYMIISILWSDHQLVSFKRFVKIVGTFIMVAIVQTESNPIEAISIIFRRCFIIHLPLSIILIRYFRNIGIGWDYMGSAEMWFGVATSKNILGQGVMICAIYFLLNIIKNWGKKKLYIDFLYLFMALYLLNGSESARSATSLSVFILGILIVLLFPALKTNLNRLKVFVIMKLIAISFLLSIAIQNSLMKSYRESIFAILFEMIGRDMTFTGRIEFWAEILDIASANPMLGTGYGAFWIGSMVNVPFSQRMSWVLGQGHNGYIDIYLQLGYVGSFLFFAVVLSGYKNIINTSIVSFEYARLKMALLSMILLVNITESSFLRGDHHLWFLFLFSISTFHNSSNIITTKKQNI
jgi:exopolysaccharide production protein ExoQ